MLAHAPMVASNLNEHNQTNKLYAESNTHLICQTSFFGGRTRNHAGNKPQRVPVENLRKGLWAKKVH